ncbi:OmpA family protein [candidate division FCPU426 bacterium]|nr:OmpA family protein [candidate division FCPU426 bacterium]
MMPKRIAVFIVLLVSLCAGSGARLALAGLYEKGGANGMGARAMGMAGAYTALAEDETAVWWNPAGLGAIDTLRVGTSLGSLYDGQLRTVNLSAAMPMTAGSAAGIHWTHDAYVQSAAIHTDALGVAGSIPLVPDQTFRLGAGVKVLFGGIPDAAAGFSGVGLDIGLQYKFQLFDQRFSLGFMAQDLDTRITWDSGLVEQIPQSLTLGSAWQIDSQSVALLDMAMIHSGQEEAQQVRVLRLGIERWFREIIGLRAGLMLDSGYASTFSFGAGFKAAGADVQYALLGQVAALGLSHRLTISYNIPPLLAKAEAPSAPAEKAAEAFHMELIALPEVFSPQSESLTDSVVFHLNILTGDWTLVGSWRLRIENTSGEVVRDFNGAQYTSQFEWDGLNREGAVCQDGTYRATLVLFDTQGKSLGEAGVSVLIRTELPGIDLRVSPRRLLLIGGRPQRSLHFRFINTAHLTNVTWSLEVSAGREKVVKTFAGEGAVPADLRWDGILADGKPVSPGSYEALLGITDIMNQRKSAVQTFTVSLVEPTIKMAVEPRLLQLGDKKLGQAVFLPTVLPEEGVQSWSLEIRHAQNQQAVRTLPGTGQPPARITWDAKDQNGRLVKKGEFFHAQLQLDYGGRNIVKGPAVALATDIGTAEAGRALALHLTMVTFSPGSATIQVDDFKRLKQAAEAVNKYAKRYQLHIKGYTDNREAKDNELELSWERAAKVKEYLNYSCNLPNDKMETVGYGSRLPLAPETSPAGRAKNRRVEVVLIIQK